MNWETFPQTLPRVRGGERGTAIIACLRAGNDFVREVFVDRSRRMAPRESVAGGGLPEGPVRAAVQRRGREALRLLAEAYRYAHELERSVWDFAVEIESLLAAGCTNSELRWLICKAYLAHASETTMPGDRGRSFRRPRPGGFDVQSQDVFRPDRSRLRLHRQLARRRPSLLREPERRTPVQRLETRGRRPTCPAPMGPRSPGTARWAPRS